MEKLYFNTTDNLKLCGIWNNYGNETIVIMCHGIRGNKDEIGLFPILVDRLKQMKVDSFRFDFRGHGESEGEFVNMTITKEVEDLESAINLIKSKGYKNIILLGASFGGGIVSLLDFDKYKEIKSLVLWYPCLRYESTNLYTDEQYDEAMNKGYTEVWNISHTKVFKLGKELLQQTKQIKPYKAIELVKIPKVFIHGDKDIHVNYKENALEPSNKSPNSKLITIKNGNHNFSRTDMKLVEDGINATIDYLKTII